MGSILGPLKTPYKHPGPNMSPVAVQICQYCPEGPKRGQKGVPKPVKKGSKRVKKGSFLGSFLGPPFEGPGQRAPVPPYLDVHMGTIRAQMAPSAQKAQKGVQKGVQNGVKKGSKRVILGPPR